MSSSTASTTWHYWCDGISTNTTATTTSNTWTNWVHVHTAGSSTTANTTYSDNTVWTMWVTASGGDIRFVAAPVAEPTEEQVAAREAGREAARIRIDEYNANLRAAEAKAAELLRANISQKQREALDKNGWFLVEGGKSKKQYRVHNDGLMEEMEGDAAVASFCVHADYNIPMPDQVLAKALCIALDEEYILRTANRLPAIRRAA